MALLSPEERRDHQKRYGRCLSLLKISGSLLFALPLFSGYFVEDYLLSRLFGGGALLAFIAVLAVTFAVQGFKINKIVPLEVFPFPYKLRKDPTPLWVMGGIIVWIDLGLIAVGLGRSNIAWGLETGAVVTSMFGVLFGPLVLLGVILSHRRNITANEVGLYVQEGHRKGHIFYAQVTALEAEVETTATGKSSSSFYVLVLHFSASSETVPLCIHSIA